MGWLDRLRDALRPRTFPPVTAPSDAYPTQVQMYEDLITELLQNWHEGGWAHLEVDAAPPIVVQVGAPSLVNTCTEPIDLPGLLRALGLEALAEVTHRVDDDPSLHRIDGATPAELAQAVHAVFGMHEGLGESYVVRGWLEG